MNHADYKDYWNFSYKLFINKDMQETQSKGSKMESASECKGSRLRWNNLTRFIQQ